MVQENKHQTALGVSIPLAAVSLGFAVIAAALVVASLMPVFTFIFAMSISLPVAYLSICQASESFKVTKNSNFFTDKFSTVKTALGVEDKLFIERFFRELWEKCDKFCESLAEYCTKEESPKHNRQTKYDTKEKPLSLSEQLFR